MKRLRQENKKRAGAGMAAVCALAVFAVWLSGAGRQEAKVCPACAAAHTKGFGVFLLADGSWCDLNPADETPPDADGAGVFTRFARDKISGAGLAVMKLPGQKRAEATLKRGSGAVKAGRLREVFCEACAKKLERALAGDPLKQFALFEAFGGQFFPVEEGALQIGEYDLEIKSAKEGYKIEIVC